MMNTAVLFFGQVRTMKLVAPLIHKMFENFPVTYYANVWRDSKEKIYRVSEIEKMFREAYPNIRKVRVTESVSLEYIMETYKPVGEPPAAQAVSFIEGLSMMLEYSDWDMLVCTRPDAFLFCNVDSKYELASYRNIVKDYYQYCEIVERRVALLQRDIRCIGWNWYRLAAPDLFYVFTREIVTELVKSFWNMYDTGTLESTLPGILIKLGCGLKEIDTADWAVYRQHMQDAGIGLDNLQDILPFILEVEPLRVLDSPVWLVQRLLQEYREYGKLRVFEDFDWNNLEKYTTQYILEHLQGEKPEEIAG